MLHPSRFSPIAMAGEIPALPFSSRDSACRVWRERFSLNLAPLDRGKLYLNDPKAWVPNSRVGEAHSATLSIRGGGDKCTLRRTRQLTVSGVLHQRLVQNRLSATESTYVRIPILFVVNGKYIVRLTLARDLQELRNIADQLVRQKSINCLGERNISIQKTLLTSVSAVALLFVPLLKSVAQDHADDQDHAEVGLLTCEQVGSRVNLIISSTAKINCKFTDVEGNVERYMGETGVGLGIDLQWKTEEVMTFTVLAAVGVDANEHALTGKYVGATVSAALGGGAGVSVLVGGSADQFSLLPVAVSGSTGIGAAMGVNYLYIQPAVDAADDEGAEEN